MTESDKYGFGLLFEMQLESLELYLIGNAIESWLRKHGAQTTADTESKRKKREGNKYSTRLKRKRVTY